MNHIWKQYSLIKFIFFFSFCFASNPLNSWIKNNKDILSNDFKSASIYLEIHSKFSDQFNNDEHWVKVYLGKNKKFRIEFKNRIVTSDGVTWRVYDQVSNQLFLQYPDKKIEKLLFSWSKINRIKAFPIKKINDQEYEIKLFDKDNFTRLYFNNNDLEKILTINKNLEIKISNIKLKKEKSIDLSIGNIDTEIFDLR